MKGSEIMRRCRTDLYHLFPALDAAFASLPAEESETVRLIGCSGEKILFNERELVKAEEEAPARLRHAYLHMLLHFLFMDFLVPCAGHEVGGSAGKTAADRDAACDGAIEVIIERECRRNPAAERMLGRSAAVRKLMEKSGRPALTAETVLKQPELLAFIEEHPDDFRMDDHAFWPGSSEDTGRMAGRWRMISSFSGIGTGGAGGSGGFGSASGSESEEAGEIRRSGTSFRSFLHRFAVSREEMELDTESFDYIYYELGLERYGNIPLIEPLEYKEGHKLEKMVIAIDTSGSCSMETVRSFLSRTAAILEETENFFSRMDVHILQCDSFIHDDTAIRSREEWYRYIDHLRIAGRGGTDFRPVFERAEKYHPSCLLYFTDGDGVYPTQPPSFDTAFVFLKRNEAFEHVPRWAERLLVTDL